MGPDNYKLEYDEMIRRNPLQANANRNWDSKASKVFTLDNYLIRIKELKSLRKDVIAFLELVHERELVLKQMHIAVNAI